jgi:hypothetical protein
VADDHDTDIDHGVGEDGGDARCENVHAGNTAANR